MAISEMDVSLNGVCWNKQLPTIIPIIVENPEFSKNEPLPRFLWKRTHWLMKERIALKPRNFPKGLQCMERCNGQKNRLKGFLQMDGKQRESN